MKGSNRWDIIVHSLAENNPSIVRVINNDCSYSDIALAFCIKRSGTEGVGYKVEYK